MGALTDPRSLSPTLGREGWCQRLLTELILEDRYPPYNSRRRPSTRGRAFLAGLDELSFGPATAPLDDPVFVDEIDFPARHTDEKGCAPDYTVFTPGRCWIIELKTEPGSHRPRQIPDYFERARHYHPDLAIDVTYLTGGLRRPFEPVCESWARYAHLEWRETVDLIRSIWGAPPESHVREIAAILLDGLKHLDLPTSAWWSHLGYRPAEAPAPAHVAVAPRPAFEAEVARVDVDDLRPILAMAEQTANDGQQRAFGLAVGGLEALHELRLAVHRACRDALEGSPLKHVQPWLWSEASSGGRALTPEGTESGYELRLSRTRRPNP